MPRLQSRQTEGKMEARPGTGTDPDPDSGEESQGETWHAAWPEPESVSGSQA